MTSTEFHELVAADIGRALRGSKNGDAWRCPCPLADRHPSRKGCGAASMFVRTNATGIDVSCMQGCEARDLRRWLKTYGFIEGAGSVRHKGDEEALAIWRQTKPLAGTQGEAFLKSQGIDLRAVPGTIRFRQPGIVRLPMIAALVQSPLGHPLALHLLLLDRDATRLAAPPLPQIATIGELGQGAVRLVPASPAVELIDDLVDALRAAQTGRSIWVSLGAWRRDRVNIPFEHAEAA